ncbi:putative cell division protein FtsL, partial [Acetobacteraceae bacterium AT-5844]
MFRPLTVIAITAFCVVGWNVYRAEDAARQLDRESRDIARKIDQARERTKVLRAEWALLNEPERLRQVAQAHLPLATMQPNQFVRLADLDRRMPTAVAFAGPVSLFGPAPGQHPPTALASAEP